MKRFTTAVVAALVLGTALGLHPAAADPIATKKAEAARLAAQLEAKGREAEILTEQYNAARLKAGVAANDAAKASKQLEEASAAVGRAQTVLKQSAVEAYVHGGFLPGAGEPITASGALEMSVRRKYMNVVADRQSDALHSLKVAQTDAATRREELNSAKQASRQALVAVESKRVAASAAVKAQQALLEKANGELAALVAAEQRRKAAEEARRVQAALAARRSPSGGPIVLNRNTGTAPTNPPPPPNAGAAKAIEEAKRQLGKPYEWGGSGPDTFDCSGLTSWAWRAGGKTLSHYTGAQWNETARVDISALQPGDLVFFGSDLHHVGLFVGNGQMIEAPSTGQVVRYSSIYRSDLVQQGGRVY